MPRSSWAVATLALTLGCAGQEPVDPEAGRVAADAGRPFIGVDQESHTQARLQAVSAVDAAVLWVSGLEGTFARTTDGGRHWMTSQVRGSEELQFRDVHAVDAETAYLLAAGPGELSRILKTTDGGDSWRRQFVNDEPEGFLDCFDFWSPERGLAYGDSVRGELYVLATEDGTSWSRVPPSALPDAGPGEGGFAASGSCVETAPGGLAWIASGAGGSARVLRTGDYGRTWAFAETPVVRGGSAGLTSVLFADELIGIALGGDLEQPDAFTDNVAISGDGGGTWGAGGRVTFAGGVYGGAWSGDGRTVIAAGPAGLSVAVDRGEAWSAIDDRDSWAVAFGDPDTFWAVGPAGRITRYSR